MAFNDVIIKALRRGFEVDDRDQFTNCALVFAYNGTGKTQHTLSAAERHKNVEQFSAAPVSLEGMRVLLCDDELPTGSTMNRCAALLKAQGAAEVAAISMTTTAMKSPSKEPTHG